ncbi:MAG: rod shape-determining protein MreC [bacterium]|nr:rod shape-determining protein MreC [bacterium]
MRSSSPNYFSRLEWLIFFLAVGLSLTLLFLGHQPSAVGFKHDTNAAAAWAARPVMIALRTFDLWRENTALRKIALRLNEENARLRDATLENARLRALLRLRDAEPWPLIAAEVIGYPGPTVGGLVLIDAGDAQGVRVNSAVLTAEGLVGKVVETGRNSSLVQTLVGNAYGVSVMIERSRVVGILRWAGPGDWTIHGLSTGDDVRVGDLVLTTGEGAVFPKNIRVGVVNKVEPPSDPRVGWCHTQPFVRFRALEEIFVIAATDTTAHSENQP